MTNAATEKGAGSASGAGSGKRIVGGARDLHELVGAHPDALRTLYEKGSPANPDDLGERPRGHVLAFGPGATMFMLLRPILRALATDALPWKGKRFDHGGNSGVNVVFGKSLFRFHADVSPSSIDGKPTLVLRYGEPSYKNPWPIRAIVDELRSVGDGVAIGPAFFTNKGERSLLLWFGLERS